MFFFSLSYYLVSFSELNKVRDGISELERFLRGALKTLDNVETQEGLQAPMNIPDVLKPCLNVAIGICDKCRQEQRLFDSLFHFNHIKPQSKTSVTYSHVISII